MRTKARDKGKLYANSTTFTITNENLLSWSLSIQAGNSEDAFTLMTCSILADIALDIALDIA